MYAHKHTYMRIYVHTYRFAFPVSSMLNKPHDTNHNIKREHWDEKSNSNNNEYKLDIILYLFIFEIL